MLKFREIKKLDCRDLKGLILLIVSFIPAWILRKRNPNIWVIVERKDDAQDNSWFFYQWVRKNHPEQPIYFIISRQARQYNPDENSMVAWGSLKHWILYLASDIQIKTIFMTAQPNPRLCSYYEKWVKKNLKNVYLRHGISKDGLEYHKYEVQRVRLFICGAKPEYDYINTNGGYPPGYVKYTGFARYDDLYNCMGNTNVKHLLIMPTWRRYLHDNRKSKEENEQSFVESVFYKNYVALLHNDSLRNFLCVNHMKAVFCIHPAFKRYEHLFRQLDSFINIVDNEEVSIHQLLLDTSLLVTDYSSVFFDVAYMDRPIVFYHFDYEEFRSKHFSEGYFSYERDGMGPVVHDEKSLVETIKGLFDGHSFVLPDKYKERTSRFFVYHDCNNCARIYNEIKKI